MARAVPASLDAVSALTHTGPFNNLVKAFADANDEMLTRLAMPAMRCFACDGATQGQVTTATTGPGDDCDNRALLAGDEAGHSRLGQWICARWPEALALTRPDQTGESVSQ